MSKQWLIRAVVPPVAACLIRAIRRTMRLRFIGREIVEGLRETKRPYIHAFWHGHLFLMPYSYVGHKIAIMISEHHDGELIARTMARFGHESIRGSTTSGGAAALRKAVRALRQGMDVGFTPDGPRGPRHVAQAGAVQAARLAGAPIVPVVFAARPRRILASWDGFVVPFPFARGLFLYGEPIEVDRGAGDEGVECARERLTSTLRDLTAKAERMMAGD